MIPCLDRALWMDNVGLNYEPTTTIKHLAMVDNMPHGLSLAQMLFCPSDFLELFYYAPLPASLPHGTSHYVTWSFMATSGESLVAS